MLGNQVIEGLGISSIIRADNPTNFFSVCLLSPKFSCRQQLSLYETCVFPVYSRHSTHYSCSSWHLLLDSHPLYSCLWRMYPQNYRSAAIFGLTVSLSSQAMCPLWKKLIFYGLFWMQTQEMFYWCSPSESNELNIRYISFLYEGGLHQTKIECRLFPP